MKTHDQNGAVATPPKPTIKYDRLPEHRKNQVREAADEEICNSHEDKKRGKAACALSAATEATMKRLSEEPLTTAAVFVAVSCLTKLAKEIINAVRYNDAMPDDDHEQGVIHELLREYCEPGEAFNEALSEYRAANLAFNWFEGRKLDEKATEMFGPKE